MSTVFGNAANMPATGYQYFTETTGVFSSSGVLADGNLLIGNASTNVPSVASITAGAGIDITSNGTGTITIDANLNWESKSNENFTAASGDGVLYNVDTTDSILTLPTPVVSDIVSVYIHTTAASRYLDVKQASPSTETIRVGTGTTNTASSEFYRSTANSHCALSLVAATTTLWIAEVAIGSWLIQT